MLGFKSQYVKDLTERTSVGVDKFYCPMLIAQTILNDVFMQAYNVL